MTQAELDALKALADAATPGPWEEVAESGEWWITGPDIDNDFVIDTTNGTKQADCDFIAATRAAVPALIAEVERLQAAWSAEHDAYIRADEQARMAKRDADELRGEVRELQNRLSAADPDIVWID